MNFSAPFTINDNNAFKLAKYSFPRKIQYIIQSCLFTQVWLSGGVHEEMCMPLIEET